MLIPVILSGGSGTRLWPVSRESSPKPFMTVGDGQSLLRKTFDRARELAGAGEVVTVTNREYLFLKGNESTFIPAGHKHRLENPGMLDLAITEVQSGDYLGEDDIVRFSDSYGRK